MIEKHEFRKMIREKISNFDESYLADSNKKITESVLSLPEYKSAKVIFTYLGMSREIDTKNIIRRSLEANKTVALPVITGPAEMEFAELHDFDADLVIGKYGIPHPKSGSVRIEPKENDVFIVPALCYDKRGYRLGWGSGYYDAYLVGRSCFTVGLCRSAVLFDHIPTESHDIPVRCVLSEDFILRLH